MRRLSLTFATTLLAYLLLVPPAWAEWVWPIRGEVITSYRNGEDPYASGQHRGIDIAAASGATVVAAASGEVRFAGTAGSSGLTVSVRTGDGRYDTSYLHLSSTSVREGDRVAAGERVGTVGTTGTRSAAAPHLHFGVRDAGSRHAYHDPLSFLPPPTATQPPRQAPAPQPAPAPVMPAPAPVPAPAGRRVPVRAPAPRRVPAGAPRRVPAGEPRRVPAGEPRRVPAGAPRRAPAGAPQGVPVGAPHHAPAGAPGRAPVAAPSPLEAPAGAPARASNQAGAHLSGASADPAPTSPSEGQPAEGAAHGERASLVASSGAASRSSGLAAMEGIHAGTAPPGPETGHVTDEPGPSHATGEPGSAQATEPSPSGPDLGLLAACLGLLAAAAVVGITQDGRKAARGTRHRIARVLHPMLGRR